ncbi:hypothetical protein ABW20_dc0100741 [Dactylellina cionopaga]|nr:hypothetical protein ABW20_dc0100741 [Dactylellina cionopaga]
MLLTSSSLLLPFATPSPLTPDFQPQPLHPAHKLYLDFRIHLARTLFRFFTFLQRVFSIERIRNSGGGANGGGSSNPGFRIAKVSRRCYIKWGVRDVEARAMCFVREHTSLPVPKVWGFLSHKAPNPKATGTASSSPGKQQSETAPAGTTRSGAGELNYMLIEALPGLPVGEAWPDMDTTAKITFKSELIGYLKELRALEQQQLQTREVDASREGQVDGSSSSTRDIQLSSVERGRRENYYIGALNRQSLTDHRIATVPYGPFDNVDAWLNCEYLLGYVTRARPDDVLERLKRELTKKKDVKVVFTHSDLTPRNVLVDKSSGKITGIVDWDSAGWCVDWWEGVKGVYGWNNGSFGKVGQKQQNHGKHTSSEVLVVAEGEGEGEESLMAVWKGLLTEVIGDFDNELKADEELRDIYGFPY